MKLVLNFILCMVIAASVCASEVRFEVSINSVSPYIFGKPVWENTQMIVGDLKGKYLGKVMVGDIRGKLSLHLLACNESDTEANVEISATLNDSNGSRLWSSASSVYSFQPNKCPTGFGYVLYGDDYDKGLQISELVFPIQLVITYNEHE